VHSTLVNNVFYGLHLGQDTLAGYYTNASAKELPSLLTAAQAGLDKVLAYPCCGSLATGVGAGSSKLAGVGVGMGAGAAMWPNAPVLRSKHVCRLWVCVCAGCIPAAALRAYNHTKPQCAQKPEHGQNDQMSRMVVPVHTLYKHKRSSKFIDYSTVKTIFRTLCGCCGSKEGLHRQNSSLPWGD
jgi:hypothetical protein